MSKEANIYVKPGHYKFSKESMYYTDKRAAVSVDAYLSSLKPNLGPKKLTNYHFLQIQSYKHNVLWEL